ncbi:Rv1355c family protein [Mycolicibacterium phlei]
MTRDTSQPVPFAAVILAAEDPALAELRADPAIAFVDNAEAQRAALRQLKPEPPEDVVAEPVRWVYYPWRRSVVSVLGPRGFRLVRLDRNRNLITADEQDRLARLTIGVVGLSVGHTIAYTLAIQGLCGHLRLADFDEMELTNLNRVPATMFDIGVNKAVVCARRIAELDPYLPVTVVSRGVTEDNVDEFVDGLDIVIEECDSLDTKVLVREVARRKAVPVLMTTSDRGLLDVERFDLDPKRPLLHGLVGDLDTATLRNLSSADRVPHSLRLVDATEVSSRMAASLIEVNQTLATWPQLSSEVALNAAATAEAVRRIGLDENLPSGRARLDITDIVDRLTNPRLDRPAPGEQAADEPAPGTAAEAIAVAAARAPSGGNCQPWRIDVRDHTVRIALDTGYVTTMDVGFRAGAVAVGAAAFNARIAAAAHRLVGRVELGADDTSPLTATLRLSAGSEPELAELYEPMLRRETNRRRGEPAPIPDAVIAALSAAAENEGAALTVLTEPQQRAEAAEILGAADRIRFLTPNLHREMFAELRWPGAADPDTGLDVGSLELGDGDLVMLDVLRRPEVMRLLAAWDGGAALGEEMRTRVASSSAIAVVSVHGDALTDYARAGGAVESVWIRAEQHGLAVQPVSPPFLYAADAADLERVSPAYAGALGELRDRFRKLAGTGPAESQALILRFAYAPRASVRSRRRGPIKHRSATGV